MPLLGIKLAIIVGTFGYFLNLASGLITASCDEFSDIDLFYCDPVMIYTINLIFNAITGLSASIIWNSFSKYVSDIATKDNKGKFFGIFYAF